MNYTVKYRKQGQWFWRTVKKVKASYPAPDCPNYVLHKEDESIVMIPFGSEMKFGSERFWLIKKEMEKEAGQQIQVNTNAREPK